MLTVYDSRPATRRSFLQAGALALGGLTLGDVLRLRAAPTAHHDSISASPKSIIMIFLSGGPSHLDMYDMKPDAPREYRGEFDPISTNVPGIEICELMPRQAKIADRFTILRGVQLAHLHTANEFYSGYPWQESPRASVPNEAQRPAVGSIISRLRGVAAIPPYVSLENQPDWERPYYLGVEYEPFRMGSSNPRQTIENMSLQGGISAERLATRKGLLGAFNNIQQNLDPSLERGLDSFQGRALEIVASGKVREAFEVQKERPAIRARYGEQPFKVMNQECNVVKYHDVAHPGRSLLMARRLIEAGVSVVTFSFYDWDTHRYNFKTLRQLLPPLDQAIHALVTDLEERGMLNDVIILLGGEFGRRPRIGDITPDGRTHWPEAGFLWLAGGGLRTGQVIGATDARGEQPVGSPIRMQNVLATLYPLLGVDPATTFRDHNGRPQYVLEQREPIAGL